MLIKSRTETELELCPVSNPQWLEFWNIPMVRINTKM